MSSDPITFAVCGFGRIGRRHAKIIDEFDGAELTGVIDVDQDTESFLEELDIDVPFYPDLYAFMENDTGGTKVVNICTPNGLHAPLAVKALENGYHTVVEKPMALSVDQCQSIIDAAEAGDRKVFVVKQNRYSPPVQWLKQVIDDGMVGEIYTVQINCYWNRDERYYRDGDWHGTMELDGGILFTQFSHFIDIMNWVFGDIDDIRARFDNYNHRELIEFEDTGLAQFRFKKGGFGSINFSISCWDKNMESSITVIGSKGSFKIGGQYMDEIEYCHIEDYEMPELESTNPPNDYGPYKGSAANHHYVIKNVVETLKGNGRATTNPYEGMKVVDIIERIYKQRSLLNPKSK